MPTINPLAIILLVASAISGAVGQVLNASIIALMVLLSAALNFFQTYPPVLHLSSLHFRHALILLHRGGRCACHSGVKQKL